MKRVVVALVLLVVAVGGYFFYRSRGPSSPPPRSADAGVAAPAAPRPAASSSAAGAPPPGLAVQFDDDPAGTLRLEGQVVDADEHPVGGALVAISTHPPREVKSETDGSFVFEGLLARGYRLTAQQGDGHAGPLAVNVTAKVEPVTLRLRKGLALEVTVLDGESDKPLAGAEVEVRDIGTQRATSDGKGVARLRGLPEGWTTVHVEARGFAPQNVVWQLVGQDTLARTVKLARGVAVSGRVVDAAGQPVAGARVLAEDATSLWQPSDPRRDSVESDAAGRWKLPAVAAGTWRFSARHGKHAPGQSATVLVDGKTAPAEVVIQLGAAGTLAGLVVDAGGQPVAYATVRVARVAASGRQDGDTRQVSCDDKGAFLLEGLPRAKTSLLAAHTSGISDVLEVDLAARPEQKDVKLVLSGSGAIAGVVVDEKGRPVPEARIIALPEGGGSPAEETRWNLLGSISDLADQAGAFTLSGLPDGEYRLRASRRGGGLEDSEIWQQDGVLARTGASGVKLVLPAEAVVIGKVLFADGSAPALYHVATSTWSPRQTPFSSKDGSFRLEAVTPGKRLLVVSGPSFATKTSKGFDLKPGADTDVGTITVERGRRVRGKVLLPDGAPAANAKVEVGPRFFGDGKSLGSEDVGKNFGNRSVTTDDSGTFDIGGVGVKPVMIVAEHEQGRSRVTPIPAGDTEVTVSLPLLVPGSLEGTVKNGGEPLDGAVVIAQTAEAWRGQFIVQSGKDGAYRYDRLSPGEYQIMAGRASMFGSAGLTTRLVTVEAGKTVRLDVELPKTDLTLAISVTGPAGEKVGNAMVFLVSGGITSTNAKDIEDTLARRGVGTLDQGMAAGGNPFLVQNLVAGSYGACALVIPEDPALKVVLEEDPDSYPVTCVPVTVSSAPNAQAVTIAARPASAP